MSDDILKTLNKRLNYLGGNQEGRMQAAKLAGLKKALLYSYQAENAILGDGRIFRCLLNPDKMKADYDIKEVSILFEDIRIGTDGVLTDFDSSSSGKTSAEVETVGMKVGDVFQIMKDNSRWLIVQQNLEEDAYFRATVYRADQKITVGDTDYWVYLRGPNETTIQWSQKSNDIWNDLNYSVVMYITKDDNTLENIHRFTKLQLPAGFIEGSQGTETNTWRVAAVNPYYYDGVIEVMLDEYYNNSFETSEETEEAEENTYITGDSVIYPFGTYTYTTTATGGEWSYDDDYQRLLRVISKTDSQIKIYVEGSRHFNFSLNYITDDETYSKSIKVESL